MTQRIDDRRLNLRHAIDECETCGSEHCDGSCQIDELDAIEHAEPFPLAEADFRRRREYIGEWVD